MASTGDIKQRLAFWKKALEKMQGAYLALVEGGVKEYRIDDRSLTRFDLPDLLEEIRRAETEVDGLEALLKGKRPRRAFGIVPRDW